MTLSTGTDVAIERYEAVGVVRMNRPERRNALSPAVMEQLADAIGDLDADESVRCIVIAGTDEVFAAGADIKAMADRQFHEVLEASTMPFWQRVADCRTPLIAAVSGFALGGGCELALLCDMIVASETAEFGQPEITLGIIPGGGGTQRLARVIGKQRTMELVLSGRRIDAKEGVRLGFVNKVSPEEELVQRRARAGRSRRPPAAAGGQAGEAGRAGGRRDGAVRRARARAPALRAGDGHRGPRRGHASVPGEAPAGVPRQVSGGRARAVGVVGAGTMGAGIAQVAALGGFETYLHDPFADALERGLETIRAGLEKGVQRERWTGGDAELALQRTHRAQRVEDLAGCDLVIEAAPEDMELKRNLFAQLSKVCEPGDGARHQHLLPPRHRACDRGRATRAAWSGCISSTRPP